MQPEGSLNDLQGGGRNAGLEQNDHEENVLEPTATFGIPNPNNQGNVNLAEALHQMAMSVATIAGALNLQQGQGQNDQPLLRNAHPRVNREMDEDRQLERFLKFGPPEFYGKPDQDEQAEGWIDSMEDIFATVNYSEGRKVRFATFKMKGHAREWWLGLRSQWEAVNKPFTWQNFVTEFQNRFIPVWVRDQKEEEFMVLKQNEMTVTQYEAKFTKLSKYCRRLIDTEPNKISKFVKGLRYELRTAMAAIPPTTYAAAVESATRIEISRKMEVTARQNAQTWLKAKRMVSSELVVGQSDGKKARVDNQPFQKFKQVAVVPTTPVNNFPTCTFCDKKGHVEANCRRKLGLCLFCGSKDHMGKDCPTRPPMQASGVVVTAKAPHFGNTKVEVGKGKPQVKAKVYAMEKQDLVEDANVIEGTLYIFNVKAKVLLDPGATHSFIAPSFVGKLDVQKEELPYRVIVHTPTGDEVTSDYVFKDCKVCIGDNELRADLISLPITGYDVILGMDWLSKHFAQVDCRRKVVFFDQPNQEKVFFYG